MMHKTILTTALITTVLATSVQAGTLLSENDFTYLGAFRVPQGSLGGEATVGNSLSFSGQGMYYDSTKNTVTVITKQRFLVELGVPAIVNSGTISSLNTAEVVQPPIDITEGNQDNIGDGKTNACGPASFYGVLKNGSKILVSATAYYASNCVYSHFLASSTWSSGGVITDSGYINMYNMNDGVAVNPNIAGQYMTDIPSEWQESLGGDALTGAGNTSMISSSSYGPALLSFTKDDMGANLVPGVKLSYYPSGNPLLEYNVDGPQPVMNKGSAFTGGIAFPDGSDTVLVFGSYGYGTNSDGSVSNGTTYYGSGTNTLSQQRDSSEMVGDVCVNKKYTCGSATIVCDPVTGGQQDCAYDPKYPSVKGPHAYPYVYRVWAYNANYLAKVKAKAIIQSSDLPYLTNIPVVGQVIQPYNVQPYDYWDISFPLTAPSTEKINLIGASYDKVNRRLFVTQANADKPGLEPFPIVHVFKLAIDNKQAPVIGSIKFLP